jgi:sugar O-acyltransferase (sialic acid O-acetyltransferase NeuD family)
MNKTKKAIIFGTGTFAEVVSFLLERDSPYEIAAYTKSDLKTEHEIFLGKPVISFHSIESLYPPSEYEMFIAIGCSKMNRVREEFFTLAKQKGYKLLSYISTKATFWDDLKTRENVFIFEDNNIQPYVSIGDGTILWSGNHIGHHSKIGSFCFITSHVVISGHCEIGDRAFIGVNATIVDGIKLDSDNLIGAGALIQSNTLEKEVYITEKAKKLSCSSERFFR